MKYLDANILIRFIIDDIPEQATYAETLIKEGNAFVLPEVFAEVVYVLTKIYSLNKTEVSTYLKMFLKYVKTHKPKILAKAFDIFETTQLDFVDCILAAYANEEQKEICTFDKKLINYIHKNNSSNYL